MMHKLDDASCHARYEIKFVYSIICKYNIYVPTCLFIYLSIYLYYFIFVFIFITTTVFYIMCTCMYLSYRYMSNEIAKLHRHALLAIQDAQAIENIMLNLCWPM